MITTTETTISSDEQYGTTASLQAPGMASLRYWNVYQQRWNETAVGPRHGLGTGEVSDEVQASWSPETREVYERALAAAAVSYGLAAAERVAAREAEHDQLDALCAAWRAERSPYEQQVLESRIATLAGRLGVDVRSLRLSPAPRS